MDDAGDTDAAPAAEYRPLPEDRRDEFYDMLTYAFRPTEGPPGLDDDDDEDEPEEKLNLGERRGMFEGERLRAVCRHHFWRSEVRDAPVDLVGLSAVASPPESRRKGLVARMLRASLREYRDRGCELSVLWPFDRDFYARYGWGTANGRAVVTCEPGDLAVFDAGDDPSEGYGHGDYRPGEFRRLHPEDWELADGVYREHAADHDLAIERSSAWWRHRRFDTWGDRPHVYAVERDGEVVGYAIYDVDDDEGRDDRTMTVFESAWIDDGALRDLLRFAHYHDSQVGEVEFHGHEDGRLRDLLDAAGADLEVRAGPMVRVVDVSAALEAITYPYGVTDTVSLTVSDPLVADNDGRFRLSVAEGTGTVERLGDAGDGTPLAETEDALAVRCSTAALSQLVVGYRSAAALSRVSDLDVAGGAGAGTGASDAIERLGRLFPPRTTYLRDSF